MAHWFMALSMFLACRPIAANGDEEVKDLSMLPAAIAVCQVFAQMQQWFTMLSPDAIAVYHVVAA